MDPSETASPAAPGRPAFPHALEDALGRPPLERKGWLTTTAPNYIGLFLWVVFYDQLGRGTLAVGGLGWSVLGAAAGGLLCFLLLYYVPATWGQRTGRPLTVLASSTFGTRGSVALTFVVLGLAQLVWLAAATYYATDWTLQGLVACRLMNPAANHPVVLGMLRLQSPLFLITSLAWCYAAALTGHYLLRVIAALMNVYPVFPALMLGVAAVLTLRGVPAFRPLAIDPATAEPIRDGGLRAFLMMIQLMFGFFANAGLEAADWGTVNRSPRDVRLGGLVGVALASWVVSTLALLIVAGALGRYPTPPGVAGPPGAGDFSVRVALVLGVGGPLAGAMFLVIGLASLAPTVYASFNFGQRITAAWPGVSRLRWTLLGTLAAWFLIATGLAARLEAIFSILGAVFAPMAGAMAADYVRSRGRWPGPRPGINPAGLVAWAAGLAIGLVPVAGASLGWTAAGRLQPAAVFAFAAAFLVDLVLARLVGEPAAVPIAEPVAASDPA